MVGLVDDLTRRRQLYHLSTCRLAAGSSSKSITARKSGESIELIPAKMLQSFSLPWNVVLGGHGNRRSYPAMSHGR